MSRPLRIEYPGAVYHITSRGNRREDIFLSDKDRETFLGVLAEAVNRFRWLVHAYCLMKNHYHLLVETPNANLSRGMRHLNGVYTQRFNRLNGREGHVFQGRYKAILVEKESHLLELCRYVALNPVRAGVAPDEADWRWSSYRAAIGAANPPNWLTTDWLLEQFSHDRAEAVRGYKQFVAEGRDADSPWKEENGMRVLGSNSFKNEIQARIKSSAVESPKKQRRLVRLTLDALRQEYPERGERMSCAYREHGYTMRAIAEDAGLHYSYISKIIKAWEGA